MKIDIFGASDIGCVRELNEDSFCIYGFDDGKPDGFCILSDGMGGHNAGKQTLQYITAYGGMPVLYKKDKQKNFF